MPTGKVLAMDEHTQPAGNGVQSSPVTIARCLNEKIKKIKKKKDPPPLQEEHQAPPAGVPVSTSERAATEF